MVAPYTGNGAYCFANALHMGLLAAGAPTPGHHFEKRREGRRADPALLRLLRGGIHL